MSTEPHPFHQTLRDALEAHGDHIDAPVPDFDELVAVRQRRTRRTLAATTSIVALVGIGGIALAADRAGEPVRDIAVDRPVRVETAEPNEFFCTDSVGEDPLGRQLFGACEPRPNGADGDYACIGRLRTDRGFVVFSDCEPVGQLGPLPGPSGNDPADDPDDPPARSTTYVVQDADVPSAVAAEHCVSVDDLAATNGWSDPSGEFPVVGNEILVPVGFDDAGCDLRPYTVTEDDTSRVRVADRFCVSVQSLDAANEETDDYSAFYPGLEIVIPPASGRAC